MTPAPKGLGPLLSRGYLADLLGESPDTLAELARGARTFYAPFNQPKRKDPTKTRQIDNPQDPLKALQRRIKVRLLERVPLPGFMMGGVRGRSARENSLLHVGRREVVTIDIRSFFPSVEAYRVFKMWRRVFRASKVVARLLTDLTTFEGHLPQGCPASNAIANLVALPLAWELKELCATRRLTFTIYVDDISISGGNARDVVGGVIGRIRAHGFCVSSRKVRVMPRTTTQEVTGNVVNQKLSNGHKKVSDLGGRLLYALRSGITKLELLRLEGSVRHIANINDGQGRRLIRLLSEVRLPDEAASEGRAASVVTVANRNVLPRHSNLDKQGDADLRAQIENVRWDAGLRPFGGTECPGSAHRDAAIDAMAPTSGEPLEARRDQDSPISFALIALPDDKQRVVDLGRRLPRRSARRRRVTTQLELAFVSEAGATSSTGELRRA